MFRSSLRSLCWSPCPRARAQVTTRSVCRDREAFTPTTALVASTCPHRCTCAVSQSWLLGVAASVVFLRVDDSRRIDQHGWASATAMTAGAGLLPSPSSRSTAWPSAARHGEAERQVLRSRDRVDLDDLASATMKPITANARPPTVMTAPAVPFTQARSHECARYGTCSVNTPIVAWN